MEKIVSYLKNHWQVVSILLISLITLIWFRGNFVIDTLDFTFPYDRSNFVNRLFYIWNSSNNLGFLDSRIFANLVPYGLYNAAVEFLGLSLPSGQKIFVYVLFMSSGLSSYYLSRQLGFSKTSALFSALFYMMNPFSLTFIWSMRSLFILSYAFIPLAVGHFIHLVKNRKFALKYSIYHALVVFLLLTSSFSNPAIIFIYFVPVLVYFILDLIDSKSLISVRFIIVSLSLFILFSSFWLVPFLFSIGTEYSNAKLIFDDDVTFLQASSKSVLDALSFLGFWALDSDYKGDPYFPWYSNKFNNFPGSILKYLPFLLYAFYIYLDNNRLRKIFTSSIIVLSLFFLTGINQLFLSLKEALLSAFPFFVRTFRNLETKFSPILLIGLVPGIGYALSNIIARKNKLLIGLFSILYLSYFGYLMSPFFTGDVIHGGGNVYPSSRVEVPEYYLEAKGWLKNQTEEFKIVGLPLSTIYQSAYKWEHGFSGTNPDRYLLGKSVLTNNIGDSFIVPLGIADAARYEDRLVDAFRIAGLANIKYILLHNDANWEFIENNKYWIATNSEQFKHLENLTSEDIIKFGELTFIPVPDQYFNKLIYFPQVIIEYVGSEEEVLDLYSNSENYWPDSALISNNSGIESNKRFVVFWGSNGFSPVTSDTGYGDRMELFFKDNAETISIESRQVGTNHEIRISTESPGFKIYNTEISGNPIESRLHKFANTGSELFIKYGEEFIKLNESDQWIKHGTYPLENGVLSLGVYKLESNTLIDNGNFEEGFWNNEVSDCSFGLSGSSRFEQSLVSGVTVESKALSLSSSNHFACVTQEVGRLQSIDIYQIEFDYKNLGNSIAKFCVWENLVEKCTVRSNARYSQEWNKHSSLFTPDTEDSKLLLYLYTESAGQENVNIYDNVKVSGYSYFGQVNLNFTPSGWLNIGTVEPQSVNENILFNNYNKTNLVENGNIVNGLWQNRPNDCSASRVGVAELSLELTDESIHKDKSFILASNNHLACVSTSINEYSQNTDYTIEITYKNKEGDAPQICLWESSVNSCLFYEKLTKTLTSSLGDGWFVWKKSFTSSIGVDAAKVFIYTDATIGSSVNIIDEVNMYKLPLSLKNTVLGKTSDKNSLPAINYEFEKINPTKYKIHTKNLNEPRLIVFAESFSPGWKMFVSGYELSSEVHVMANGYANGWWIDPSKLPNNIKNERGEYDIILNFEPQKYFYYGSFLSLSSLIACLAYLGYGMVIKKRLK